MTRPLKQRPVPTLFDHDGEQTRRRLMGERVTARRKELNLTIRDLAIKSGFSHEQIRRLEGGQTDAKLSTLVHLANALECALVWLILGEGEKTNANFLSLAR